MPSSHDWISSLFAPRRYSNNQKCPNAHEACTGLRIFCNWLSDSVLGMLRWTLKKILHGFLGNSVFFMSHVVRVICEVGFFIFLFIYVPECLEKQPSKRRLNKRCNAGWFSFSLHMKSTPLFFPTGGIFGDELVLLSAAAKYVQVWRYNYHYGLPDMST